MTELDRREVLAGSVAAVVAAMGLVPSAATAAAAAPVAGGATLTAEQALINKLLAALYDAERIISCGPTFYGEVKNIPAFYEDHQRMIGQARAFGIERGLAREQVQFRKDVARWQIESLQERMAAGLVCP
jgi:hypothetical protein